MTTRELGQLYYLKREIAMYEREIAHLRRNREDDGAEIETALREKKKSAEQERLRLELFIAGIPDSLVRQIFTLRFCESYSWAQVALAVGGGNTADGVRMICTRYLAEKQ